MNEHEEHAAYLNGLMRWRLGTQDQAERVRRARSEFSDASRQVPAGLVPAGSRLKANWTLTEQWRVRNEVAFLLVAVRNVLRFAEALAKTLGGDDIREALKHFRDAEPHADLLRNIHEHLDEYIAGGGRQRARFPGSPTEGSIEILPDDVRYEIGGIVFTIESLIEHSLELSAAAIQAAQGVLYGSEGPSTT